MFKKFRKSLSEFIERLIASSADLGALYTSDLMATLQTWVVAMSSSQIRSFRHTATVLALEVETALCDVAASVEKEAEVVGRQREGEKKRKASNKGVGAREKELQAKAQEIRGRRDKLAEFLKEFVDGYVAAITSVILFLWDISFLAFLFIGIAISTLIFEQNVYALLDFGSRNIPRISLMLHIYVTLGGFFRIQQPKFGSKR